MAHAARPGSPRLSLTGPIPLRAMGAASAALLTGPLALMVAGPASGSVTGVPAPPTKALPSALDIALPYQPPRYCLGQDLPGPVAFAKLLNANYGAHAYGVLRGCDLEHGEGRAMDWMVNANTADGLALGNAITRWLTAPDAQGRPSAMARRFGIMYIIWNRQMYRVYDPARGWAPYSGSSPHTDHIHFSFTWDGAYKNTSWWTGSALTMPKFTGPVATAPATTTTMTPSGYPVLKLGATGTDVRTAQAVIGTTMDGAFGPLTQAALKLWQGKNSVPATGVLDATTWAKMVSLRLIPSRTSSTTTSGTTTTPSLATYAGTTLRLGSRGPAVTALQKALGGLVADGVFGPLTEAKVKAYQQAHGLKVTGIVEATTWAALTGKATTTTTRTTTTTTSPLAAYTGTTLRLGSRGPAVTALQKALGGLVADGIFGSLTEAKVKAYQKAHALRVTGIVEATTWAALTGKATTTTTRTTTTTSPLAAYTGTTLRLGSRGPAVTALQKALGGLVADGIFGSLTEAKVKAYQKAHALRVTGIVEATTWAALTGKATTTTTTTTTTPGVTTTSLATEFTPYLGTTLKLGSSGTAVKVLQRALGGLTVDGAFGSLTQGAVKAFQSKHGLAATGVVDKATWLALEKATHPLLPYWGTVLKEGSSGTAVKALQRALGGLTVDGAFGSQTAAAVKAAQKRAGLAQTGVVATQTWKAIETQSR